MLDALKCFISIIIIRNPTFNILKLQTNKQTHRQTVELLAIVHG